MNYIYCVAALWEFSGKGFRLARAPIARETPKWISISMPYDVLAFPYCRMRPIDVSRTPEMAIQRWLSGTAIEIDNLEKRLKALQSGIEGVKRGELLRDFREE